LAYGVAAVSMLPRESGCRVHAIQPDQADTIALGGEDRVQHEVTAIAVFLSPEDGLGDILGVKLPLL
jgi:hypothetical protein